MGSLDELFERAKAVRERAYARYSGFKVGAAIRDADGAVHVGANVENAAYPQSQCAEASAIGAMIAAGVPRIAEMVIIAAGETLVTPCGGCRQRIAEFASAETRIHLADPDGIRMSLTLGDLLPYAFGPRHVGDASADE